MVGEKAPVMLCFRGLSNSVMIETSTKLLQYLSVGTAVGVRLLLFLGVVLHI